MAVLLDFKKKNPNKYEILEQLVQLEMEKQAAFLTHIHLMLIAILRRMSDRGILEPDDLVEMSHEQFANDNFAAMLLALDQEFVAKHNMGIKIKYNKSLWHRIKDWIRGVDTGAKVKIERVDDGQTSQAPQQQGQEADSVRQDAPAGEKVG